MLKVTCVACNKTRIEISEWGRIYCVGCGAVQKELCVKPHKTEQQSYDVKAVELLSQALLIFNKRGINAEVAANNWLYSVEQFLNEEKGRDN